KVWGQTLLANDDNGEGDTAGLTAVLATGPMMGGMDLRGNGHFTYTPPVDYYGVMTFTYQADDGVSLSAPAMVTMTVLPINDAPWSGVDVYTTTANTDLVVGSVEGVLANDWDVEGHVFTPTLGVGVAEGTLIWAGDGGFTYQPPTDFTGVVTFTYVISEGNGDLVLSEQKISSTAGGLGAGLGNGDFFGNYGHRIGDLDGDGVDEIAIGAPSDNDGGPDRGAVWILFMNSDGTVRTKQKISSTAGGFGAGLDDDDNFGAGLAAIGDLDGDGVVDLGVSAFYDGDGGYRRGAMWILFLNRDGTVKTKQKISSLQGGFTGPLSNEDRFGVNAKQIGDLDGDGLLEIAVGAYGDDDGGSARGAVWILFLNPDGTVRYEQKISSTSGGFGVGLNNGDLFGAGIAPLGDLDDDGVDDIVVGAFSDEGLGSNRGAVWVLFLNSDGTVKAKQKIGDMVGGFQGALDNDDLFGGDIHYLNDINGDGIGDIAVGAYGDDDGGDWRGSIWILLLNRDGSVKEFFKLSDIVGGFEGALDNDDLFGDSITYGGDYDNNGVLDLMIGARGDDDGGADRGAMWVLMMAPQAEREVEVTIVVEQACSIPEQVINNEIDLSLPDLYFNWDVNGAVEYELWRSNDPYFVLGDGGIIQEDISSTVPLAHFGGAGDVSANNYYGITAVGDCGDRAELSTRMGEFDYSIVIGQ
ncbi:MAG TPA: tandem-95 repeat protein, partial [Anaerolineae bacterium]|nr:tandem-95 repeat protein [Anaerolineae bacterium]